MDIPSFSEFQMTLTDEKLKEMLPYYNFTETITLVDGVTPENVSAALSRLFEVSAERNLMVQVALLRAYHEWLRAQIEG